MEILKGLSIFWLVSACDLAKEIESISHKNRITEVKAAASQLTLLRADQLSQATLPNSTLNLAPSSQSADNLRLHTVSVLTTSTNATTESGDESYLQIAQPKRSFDEDTDTIVSRERWSYISISQPKFWLWNHTNPIAPVTVLLKS